MRFRLTDEQRLARDATRAFLAAEQPLRVARASLEEPVAFSVDLWKRAADLGWTSPLVPEELGGGALSDEPLVDLSIVAAEVGRSVGSGPLVEVSVALAALAATDRLELREHWLPRLLDGTDVVGWAVDHKGWLAQAPGTLTASRLADGLVRVAGDAVGAAPAGARAVLVSTPDVTCLVPTDAPGLTSTSLHWLDPSTRHSRWSFDDVVVAESDIVAGPEGLERLSQLAWVLQAAELTGIVDAVFALTLEWLADRHSFGRPLASYQALKHRCADMKVWVEATHAIADAAATAVAGGSDDGAVLARAAKAYASDHAVELIQDCIQLHGGIGVTWEHDLHLYLRRAMLIRASYGTPSEILEDLAMTALAERSA